MAMRNEGEVIATELSVLGRKVVDLEARMDELETVIRRLEDAALTTARALSEVSTHWDAVYEAMRRKDDSNRPNN
jgi:hypothetical protein